MAIRNCKTRPISWKTHRNKALADAVIKMGEYYKDIRKGFVVWPVWMGFLTHRDNVGYFDGAIGMMRDSFFPHHPEITPEEVHIARDILADVGLIIVYQVNGIEYVLVPKVGNWSRIIGNVSDQTDFPLPPQEVITAWEQRFNEVYTPLIRRSNGVSPESKSKSKSKYISGIHQFFNNLPEDWFDEIKKLYPKIDFQVEFNKMKAWLISNPQNPKKNLKQFAINWLNRARTQPDQPFRGAARISEEIINNKLGRIATKDMIKAFLRDIPQETWGQVDRFLRKRYLGSDGRAFMEAERELISEMRLAKDKIGRLTRSIGK